MDLGVLVATLRVPHFMYRRCRSRRWGGLNGLSAGLRGLRGLRGLGEDGVLLQQMPHEKPHRPRRGIGEGASVVGRLPVVDGYRAAALPRRRERAHEPRKRHGAEHLHPTPTKGHADGQLPQLVQVPVECSPENGWRGLGGVDIFFAIDSTSTATASTSTFTTTAIISTSSAIDTIAASTAHDDGCAGDATLVTWMAGDGCRAY